MAARRIWSLGDLSQLFQERLQEVPEMVWGLPAAAVSASPESVTNEIVTQFEFQPIDLNVSAMTRSEISAGRYAKLGPGGFQRVPADILGLHSVLWRTRAIALSAINTRRARLRNLRLRSDGRTAGWTVHRQIDRVQASRQVEEFKLVEIQVFVAWANTDAARFNAGLRERVRATVLERKQLLDETAELDAALEIPFALVPVVVRLRSL